MTASHLGATTARQAGGTARQAVRSRPMRALTRFGFIAYAVMHALVGWLALQIAWGGSGREDSQSGAFSTLAAHPLGRVLLFAVAVGLAALAVWQAVAAAVGHTDEEGRRRAAERFMSAGRTVVYAALAWTAFRIVAGSGTSSAQKQESATATLISSTGGRWLVGAVGLAVIGFGVGMAVYGLLGKFERKLDRSRMGPSAERAVHTLGAVGYAAKGVAFAIVGVLLILAAVHHDPSRSRGLDAALRALAAQPFGPWLLSVVALGFLAFGAFCLFQSRYRRV
ncbi:DUF1206 domain-containing protein [Planosporangium thailandense]|uniref:DUF1206 domain-containing protein n=1 Tax=Planosporangium thailandense TaxID=765197 RepID=A0ABX0Y607_9ACTN|nr:DUF1206 domain-containing protein [Planosporangium thailandense]NJC73832.1 DUF1206 domain-containing protein [Planosporangium thailandense]